MRASQVAELVGCTVVTITRLARSGKIKAKKVPSANLAGFEYSITEAEALKYKNKPQKQGWPRGKKHSGVKGKK